MSEVEFLLCCIALILLLALYAVAGTIEYQSEIATRRAQEEMIGASYYEAG